jgi:hypothetical protein
LYARSIYKYRLDPGVTKLKLQGPILSCGVQGNDIMVWAIYDEAVGEKTVKVEVVGTGHPLYELSVRQFLGTVFIDGLVFHIFVVQ